MLPAHREEEMAEWVEIVTEESDDDEDDEGVGCVAMDEARGKSLSESCSVPEAPPQED